VAPAKETADTVVLPDSNPGGPGADSYPLLADRQVEDSPSSQDSVNHYIGTPRTEDTTDLLIAIPDSEDTAPAWLDSVRCPLLSPLAVELLANNALDSMTSENADANMEKRKRDQGEESDDKENVHRNRERIPAPMTPPQMVDVNMMMASFGTMLTTHLDAQTKTLSDSFDGKLTVHKQEVTQELLAHRSEVYDLIKEQDNKIVAMRNEFESDRKSTTSMFSNATSMMGTSSSDAEFIPCFLTISGGLGQKRFSRNQQGRC